MTALFWFTNDLRLADNPGLAAAARDHEATVPLYVMDEGDPWAPGEASRWWLHHSLAHLQNAIAQQEGTLLLRRGSAIDIISALCEKLQISAVYFSRGYEPWLAQQQEILFNSLEKKGITCKRYSSRLLLEPDQILNQQGKPFQVFTPFYRRALKTPNFSPPITMPKIEWSSTKDSLAENLCQWQLRPTSPDWAQPFLQWWQPGEDGARETLNQSLNEIIERYQEARDCPALLGTSRLSPALHFGELSPRQIWTTAKEHSGLDYEASAPFLRQLIWREFSYYLLHHWPEITDKPFKKDFSHFPWQQNAEALVAWQQGLTGYPIVDAGMRELWHTGWIHNRVRMIAASFLTKHLRIHWREGAQWFWNTLLDADLANNSASWQWVAGSGADASPYFRIFNPTLQGEKFDKKGEYIRQWIPELKALPDKYIHTPWQAPQHVLQAAGVMLGRDYPAPIVNHREAREQALGAYRATRDRSSVTPT